MHMSRQSDRIRRIADGLIEYAAKVERSQLRSFGYRERIAIERLLFLVLKDICSITLQYSLQGLTEAHRLALLDVVRSKNPASEVNGLVTEIFELRVFLYSLSSANPYVQGDALSRVELTEKSVTNFIGKELCKIATLAQEFGIPSEFA